MLTVGDEQRRARLGRRHGLAPGHRFHDVVEATRAMTALHATEVSTPHLSLHARMAEVSIAEVDDALYEHRSLLKLMAMRRTLWVVERAMAPAVVGSAGRRVADAERKRLLKEAVDLTDARGPRWIDDAARAVVDALSGREMSTAELRDAVPEFGGVVVAAPGTKWATPTPIMARLMTLFTAEGLVVRGRNAGSWRTARPTYTATASWLGDHLDGVDAHDGYVAIVDRWLRTFGPGTEDDLVWWLGSTKTVVRAALAAVEAVAVRLDSGASAWIHPDDEAEFVDAQAGDDDSWVALLPTLDPTTMGWRGRDFYLDPAHVPYLFDRAGNGGTTVWVDGRIVGCWIQDDDGAVRPILREPISDEAADLLAGEVLRLDAFLDGERITNVFASPQMRRQPLS